MHPEPAAQPSSAPSPCIACGGRPGAVVLTFDDRGAARDLRRCAICRHHFLDGWEEGYDLHLYDYYADRVGRALDDLYDPLTTERLHDVLHELGRSTTGRRLLDVGCGEGQLVAAGLALGFHARGIDVAPGAIAVCRSFELPCEEQDLFAPELDDVRFDIVTLSETIEHVPDPLGMLRRIRDLLAPGGVLWLTTPNFSSLGRRILGAGWPPLSPEHLSYFTPDSMRGVATRAGFASVELRTRSISAAALRGLLPRARRGSVATPAALDGEPEVTGFAAEQRFRHRIEASPVLRTAKRGVNGAMAVTGLGETLVATLRATGG